MDAGVYVLVSVYRIHIEVNVTNTLANEGFVRSHQRQKKTKRKKYHRVV